MLRQNMKNQNSRFYRQGKWPSKVKEKHVETINYAQKKNLKQT